MRGDDGGALRNGPAADAYNPSVGSDVSLYAGLFRAIEAIGMRDRFPS